MRHHTHTPGLGVAAPQTGTGRMPRHVDGAPAHHLTPVLHNGGHRRVSSLAAWQGAAWCVLTVVHRFDAGARSGPH